MLRRAPRIITMEEGALQGGFGSAILEFLQEESIACENVLRLGFPDQFIQHGNRNVLLTSMGLDADSVAKRLKNEFFKDPSLRRFADNLLTLKRN